MKKRIKEVVDSDGVSTFFIQTKFIFWWTENYPQFMSKEGAEKWLNYKPEYVVKYH